MYNRVVVVFLLAVLYISVIAAADPNNRRGGSSSTRQTSTSTSTSTVQVQPFSDVDAEQPESNEAETTSDDLLRQLREFAEAQMLYDVERQSERVATELETQGVDTQGGPVLNLSEVTTIPGTLDTPGTPQSEQQAGDAAQSATSRDAVESTDNSASPAVNNMAESPETPAIEFEFPDFEIPDLSLASDTVNVDNSIGGDSNGGTLGVSALFNAINNVWGLPSIDYAAIGGTADGIMLPCELNSMKIALLDRLAIKAACQQAFVSAYGNPCNECLCVLSSELSKVGLDVTSPGSIARCGEALASTLMFANITRDQGVYLMQACPAQCRNANGDSSSCPLANPMCQERTGYPFPFEPPPGYSDQMDYCRRYLQLMPPWKTDKMFATSLPMTGNLPKGCVKGCILGMAPQDIYTRSFSWRGKCFFPQNVKDSRGEPEWPEVMNYQEPGRILAIPGALDDGTSWFDGQPTLFLDYPFDLFWMVITWIATQMRLMDYTDFHDEIREVPDQPGLFVGLSYAIPNSQANGTPFRAVGIRFILMQTAEGLVEHSAFGGEMPGRM